MAEITVTAVTVVARAAVGTVGLVAGAVLFAENTGEGADRVEPKEGSSGGKGAGKGFPDKVKEAAREESNNACVFCGVGTTKGPGPQKSEIDHAIPKSRGGNNSLENAQNTCRTCNRQKGAKTTQEFLDNL